MEVLIMEKLTNTLSENAVLVRMTAKHPSGIRTDKALKRNLAKETEVSSERLLGVSKHIYGEDINKYFRSILNEFRNSFYYPMTLPWADNSTDWDNKVVSGWRLCPNSQLESLQNAVDEAKQKWDKEVDGFLKSYPQKMEQAKRNLGKAFNECDYPTFDELRSKFRFDFEISTVPQYGSDIRLNVSEKLRSKIENDVKNRINNNIKNVLKTTVDAVLEQTDHLAKKLREYDPKQKQKGFFNASSFKALEKLTGSLPNINSDILGNDQDIADAHQKLVSVVATFNGYNNGIDSLREDDALADQKRKDLADKLEESADSLKGGFLGRAFGGKKDD